MFGIDSRSKQVKSKSKPKKKAKAPPKISPDLDKHIHVMPREFYRPVKQSNTRMMLILGGVIIILALVFGFGYWLTQTLRQVGDTLTDGEPVQSSLTPPGEASSQPSNLTPSPDPATPVNVNTTINVNINSSPPPPTEPTVSPDSDGDSLLDPEEALFGSNRNLADTDGDGFNDAQEVINGFDPNSNQTLIAVNLANLFQNNSVGYQVLIPSSWGTPRRSANDRLIIVIIPGGSKIEIQVRDNPSSQTAGEIFLSLFPQAAVESITANDNTIALSTTGRQAVILPNADNSAYYLISYTLASNNVVQYPNVVRMMAQSFTAI